jgi:RNA polymerase sigma-70 factor, ECF subfamily
MPKPNSFKLEASCLGVSARHKSDVALPYNGLLDEAGDITRLLGELRSGNKAAESRLLELVYPELRKIAARYLRREPSGHTLQPTALVNEAYLQLAGQMDKDWHNRNHFFAVASQLMRRILVDYARSRKAAKRDGGRARFELTEGIAISDDRLDEILFIDEALGRLAELDSRKSKVVELRFFGGLSDEEVATVLNVAPRTVRRDWNFAKAWLHGELRTGPADA